MSQLTRQEQLFCAAYVTTAQRDVRLAAMHAGMRPPASKLAARALLARPAIRAELERMSMQAEIVDGRLVDVTPIPLTENDASVRGLKAARRVLQRDRGGLPPSSLKTRQNQSVDVSRNAPQKPEKPDSGGKNTTPRAKKMPKSTRAIHEKVKKHIDELDMGMPEEPIPSDDLTARRAQRTVELLTSNGEVAGTLKETVTRLERARRKKTKLASKPDERVKNPDALLARLNSLKEKGATNEQPNGQVTVWVEGEVATRYEVKKWLTAVMTGQLTSDVSVRMQAAGLLGKSLGMFDSKTIERERELDEIVPTTEEDVRKEIEKTKLELVRLGA